MKTVIANFLQQPNRDFPLDCETMDAIQMNTALVAVLGNIAGDKSVLTGCRPDEAGTSVGEGYVFVKTKDFPDGEVLYFEGGSVTTGVYVKTEDIGVQAQGYSYPKAYVRRTLAAGLGTENFKWEDFKYIKTNTELEKLIAEFRKKHEEDLQRLAPSPLGCVQMWAGKNVPDNYVLCDGRQLKTEDYPELSTVLDGAFNTAKSALGVPYKTNVGYFRVPDLRGRFIVGQDETDEEYNVQGNTGGEKMHRLTTDELPAHRHVFTDDGNASSSDFPIMAELKNEGVVEAGKSFNPNKASSSVQETAASGGGNGCAYLTGYTGLGGQHENRPPYYVLAYIMRVK